MLKNLLAILSLACLATSCSSLRPSASKPAPTTSSATAQPTSSIEFINTIAIRSDGKNNSSGDKKVLPVNADSRGYTTNTASNSTSSASYSGDMEKHSALQFKFAILENAAIEELDNDKLLSFMEYWYGTRYQYGGSTRDGIDCSAFAFLLMSSVYSVGALPRTAKEQYVASRRIRRDELQEGDLVFFHTLGKRKAVTHVGVYLRNNKFVHASVSGVMISDMNDGYYDKHYIGAGRILNPPSTAQQAPVSQTQASR